METALLTFVRLQANQPRGKITAQMKKAFRITAKSVAAPLSFDQARVKYGASEADVRAVRMFVLTDAAGSPVVVRKRTSRASASRRRSTQTVGTRKK
jgi:hypothetical protein